MRYRELSPRTCFQDLRVLVIVGKAYIPWKNGDSLASRRAMRSMRDVRHGYSHSTRVAALILPCEPEIGSVLLGEHLVLDTVNMTVGDKAPFPNALSPVFQTIMHSQESSVQLSSVSFVSETEPWIL